MDCSTKEPRYAGLSKRLSALVGWVGARSVEPVLKRQLTESELALIERKIVECKDAGWEDQFAIFYSCLIELPDYEGELETLEQLLRERFESEIGLRMH